MNSSLSFEKTQELVGNISIPSAPAVLLELHEAMQQDEPELSRIAELIERDIGMAGLVMKTINSPLFGMKNKVTSIRQAMALLGLINISNIVAGLALKRALEVDGAEPPPEFWESPVNVAMVSATLAQRYGGLQPDEAYMIGLFRDAREVLLAQRFPDYISLLHRVRTEGLCQVDEEDRRYQTNHAILGYFISSGWRLPEHVQQIILRHHEASAFLTEDGGRATTPRTLMAVLKMAEHIDACFWGRRENTEWATHGDAVLDYLGVSSIEFLDVADDMVELLIAGQS